MPDTWQIAHTVIFLIYLERIMKITVPYVNVMYSNTFYISVEVYKPFALCGCGAVQYIIQYKIIKYIYCINCNLIVM